MNLNLPSNGRPRRWILHLQCLGVAITAALVVTILFCPRFGNWKGVVLIHGPIATDYGRAVAAFHQIESPWTPIVVQLHKIIAWRLLFPVVWHYLKLPFGLYLATPHLGCLLTLWLAARLAQKHFDNWRYTWMTVALLATLPWFFVSTGWLGYFDSWVALGMLIVSCVPSRWALAFVCLLVPWIDERFVLSLPSCMIVRFIIIYDGERVSSRELLRDIYVVAAASLVYPAVRLAAFLHGDPLTTDYVTSHLDEIEKVFWPQFLDGLWSGYRAAWIMILAGIYFWWRQSGWLWGILLTLVFAVSAIGSLFIAADMSRSTMIVLPALLLGIWLWSKTKPQTFKWVLPAVLVANLSLPAAHVMWNLRIPIHSYFAVRAESTPQYLDPAIYTQQGQVYLDEGKLAEAGNAFDTALRLDDRFASAYVLRAVQRIRQDDIKGALQDTDRALSIEPNTADALYVSAVLAQRNGDVVSAKSKVQKAIQNAPLDWPRRNEAQKLFEQLRILSP